MKTAALITLFLMLASCSSKLVKLTTTNYDLKGEAKVSISFLKKKSRKIDIGLLALSTKEVAVAIKREDFSCGLGTEPGVITKIERIGKVPFIILSRTAFTEIVLICDNPNFKTATGEAYFGIKNLYSLQDGVPSKVLASDIKIELK